MILKEMTRVIKQYGVIIIQIPNLDWLLEPHTKFPFLAYMPSILRKYALLFTNYEGLQMNCKLKI